MIKRLYTIRVEGDTNIYNFIQYHFFGELCGSYKYCAIELTSYTQVSNKIQTSINHYELFEDSSYEDIRKIYRDVMKIFSNGGHGTELTLKYILSEVEDI